MTPDRTLPCVRAASTPRTRPSTSLDSTGLRSQSTTPGGTCDQSHLRCADIGRGDADHRHFGQALVALELRAERDRFLRVADKFEHDHIDLRILLQERHRLRQIFGRIDGFEILRVQRIEQHAAVVALRGDDEDRTLARLLGTSGYPAPVAQTRLAGRFERVLDVVGQRVETFRQTSRVRR